jgi:TonB family protein
MFSDLIRHSHSAFVISMILFIGSGLALAAQPKSLKTPTEARESSSPSQSDKSVPDNGHVSDNVYTNDFFEFTYQFPKGWSVGGGEIKQFMSEVIHATAPEDPIQKALFDVLMQHTQYLLVVSEHPFGTPVPENPGILVIAQDVSFAPGIENGTDFLKLISRSVAAKSKYRIDREPYEFTIGRQPFSRMDVEMDAPNGTTVRQSSVATIINRHAIWFVFSATDQKRLEALVETLNTFELKPQTVSPEAASTSAGPPPKTAEKMNAVQILTPTDGVDFSSYIRRMMATIKAKWYERMPESARKGQKGEVVVQFQVEKNGKISGETIETGSGDVALDQVALQAIERSDPIESLPAGFFRPYITLRVIFLYNLPMETTSGRVKPD